MALSILDGNQSATTLSTIVTSGQHIPAHTVVSIGTQAITDISGAISGSTVCVGNLGLLQSTVATEGLSASGSFIKIGGHTGTSTTGNIVHVSAVGALRVDGSVYTQPVSIASVTIGNTVTIAGTVTANPTGTQTIAGTVTAGNLPISPFGGVNTQLINDEGNAIGIDVPFLISSFNSQNIPISGVVTVSNIQTVTLGTAFGTTIKYPTALACYDVSSGSWQAIPLTNAENANGAVKIGNISGVFREDNRLPISGTVTIGAGTAQIGSVTASISNSLTIGSIPVISGTVTVGAFSSVSVGSSALLAGGLRSASVEPLRLDVGTGYLQVKVESAPSISGTVTLGAGTAQIGSVTASISNSVTIASFATSVTARLINPAGTAVTYAEVGTAGNPSIDVLSVQGVTSGTPLTILNHQGTTVTTSNFTSTTASTVLASANTSREVLTIFNEGAGNLHICAGATCTTIAYQVRLSAGDYYEVPLNQTSLTHSAVFATAGTARIVQIS